jgi:membrane protease YdiL (CAAX protease family)
VGLVAQIGALPAAALVADRASPGLAAVGFALAVPCAFAPYWLELALSALLHGRHKLPVTGLDGARDSVAEASTDRRRFALVAVLTAVAEEVLFRGAVLHEVTTHRGALLGVIAASLVFGLHHVSFGLPAIAGKTLAGVLWAGLMLLTGLIAVPLVAHLLFQSLVYRRMVRTRP